MQVFYSKDGKLKFEILDDSVYIKHNNDIYEIIDCKDEIKVTKNGKDMKPKKKLPQIKKRVISPFEHTDRIYIKSELADG